MTQKQTKIIKFVLFFITLTVSMAIFKYRSNLAQFSKYGYFGIFLGTFLSSATVLLPLPGTLLVIAGSSVFNPFLTAIFAATGEATGEMVGYIIGRTGRHLLVNENKNYQKARSIVHKYGYFGVMVFTFIPNPIFDFIGIVSGIFRLSVVRFYISCYIGKLAKNLLLTNLFGLL